MRISIIAFFLTLIAALHAFPILAQKLTYTIYRGANEIGEIEATLTQNENSDRYFITSSSDFKVIWNYTYATHMDVVYMDGILEKSLSKTYMNEDLEEMSITSRKSNTYHCVKYPEDTFEMKAPITFSTAKLYFEEPLGLAQIYSESHLTHCKLEAMGNQKYKLELPDNKINYYTYEKNKLVEIYVDRSWFDIVFKLKEEGNLGKEQPD